jgi:hypothetical protein
MRHKHTSRTDPQLAICVREAIEECLSYRQTVLANKGQTKNNVQERIKDNLRQTENTILLVDTAPQGEKSEIRQTKNVPAMVEENNGQTENGPAYGGRNSPVVQPLNRFSRLRGSAAHFVYIFNLYN